MACLDRKTKRFFMKCFLTRHYLPSRKRKNRIYLWTATALLFVTFLLILFCARFILTPNHTHRHSLVRQGCEELEDSDWLNKWPLVQDLPKMTSDPIVLTNRNLLFCVVDNVASFFFIRWMMSIDKTWSMTSHFDIPRETVGRHRLETLSRMGPPGVQMRFLESSTKVVFGRNPYARIFSAYVEKVFTPNPYYWKHWGVEAILHDNAIHKGRHASVKDCGAHATFPQFMRYVTTNLAMTDKRLRQVADECDMCEMYYDVIGNLETVFSDLDYISGQISVLSQFQHENDYYNRFLEDSITKTVNETYSWLKDIKSCLSVGEMGLRLWRAFQIRGFIDSDIAFPFQPGAMDDVSEEDFIKASKGAARASPNRHRLEKQWTVAMEEAYLSLKIDDLYYIIAAYGKDFVLFGYPSKPPYLYDKAYRRNLTRTTNALNWDALWNVHSVS